MFLGHYALALAARRQTPATSLGVLVAATQLPDLMWPFLLLFGVERVEPGDRGLTALRFTHYPWSHSLLMVIAWGMLAGILYYAVRRASRREGVWVAALVLSHWVLDFATHRPDLPLYPGGSHRLGLGLWNHPTATVLIEGVMWFGAIALYLRSTQGATRMQQVGFGVLAVLLTLLYAGNLGAQAPENTAAVAYGAAAGLLVPVWAHFVDRKRRVSGAAAATPATS